MKKNLLFYIIIFLLAVNLSLLFTFIVKQNRIDKKIETERRAHAEPERDGRGAFMHTLRENLNLEDEEFEAIKNKMQEFHTANRELHSRIEELRFDFYQELSSGSPDLKKLNTLAEDLGNQQSILMKNSFKHYLDIRAMLPPEKVDLIDSLTIGKWSREHYHKGRGKGRHNGYQNKNKHKNWRHNE